MAQVKLRIDDNLKEKDVRIAEQDPFYSKSNMNRLRIAIADAKAGRNMTEHELIEVEDD